ncbi:AhpC/Tsa family protein, selenocysteine-containing [Hymenobacter roseosalivarius DSM 11622]|uniref:AhpC/Tsa family protein, selenocysteine-containing n=1 Tax=Hymenobacter roseosalivarius DSM 11622 TaxID=645990 RepID=A0A1W1VRZ0_9BACT|nr:AhpC/Tsa family protein, selenocysteine-containing [Hymenobacter roseosalivarius DSM 11622]
MLSDVGNEVARQYGLAYSIGEAVYTTLKGVGINLEEYNNDDSGELPLTATFVISSEGVIVWAETDADFKRRPDPTTIFPALAAL